MLTLLSLSCEGPRAPGAERALQQSLERMTNCIEFKQLQGDNMQTWLQQQSQSGK